MDDSCISNETSMIRGGVGQELEESLDSRPHLNLFPRQVDGC